MTRNSYETSNNIFLLGVVFIAVTNWLARGMFNVFLTPMLILSLVLITILYLKNLDCLVINEKSFLLASTLLFGITLLNPSLIYARNDLLTSVRSMQIFQCILVAALVCTISLYLILSLKIINQPLFNKVGIAIIVIIILAHCLVLKISPFPIIDVYVVDSVGADFFLSGKNPYSQVYPDIYHGAMGYEPGYTYWPFYLVCSVLPRLLGDIRILTVISTALTVLFLILIARKFGRITECLSAVVFLLALPGSYFITEQAWIDGLLLVILSFMSYCVLTHRWSMSAIALACFISTKQYGVLAFLPTFIFWIRCLGLKKAINLSLCTAFTAIIIFLPFLISDFDSFFKNSVKILAILPQRFDSSSIPSLYKYFTGMEIQGNVLIASYLLIIAFFACLQWKSQQLIRSWLMTIAFTYGWIFIMGKQAFANYHHFALSVLIMSFALPMGCIATKNITK